MTKTFLSALLIGLTLSLIAEQPATPECVPSIELQDGTKLPLKIDTTKLEVSLEKSVIKGNPKAARLSERKDQEYTSLAVIPPNDNLKVEFKQFTHNDKDVNYERVVYEITPKKEPVVIKNFFLLDQCKLKNTTRIGYTDGSVIQHNNEIIGIEHPMSRVKVSSPISTQWTPNDFTAGTQKISIPEDLNGANLTLEFTWSKGRHRIDIESVQVLNEKGEMISEDRHEGFAGLGIQNNLYKVSIPAQGKYTLNCVYKRNNEYNSYGNIDVISDKGEAIVTMSLPRNYELKVGETWSVSVVLVKTTSGQERRQFQAYLEKERAHPYRVFPHYNSWFDICIFVYGNNDPLKRMTEERVLKSMRMINEELYKKRGVNIESYLLDDGWDDWNTLWDYHAGFPNKFDKIDEEVKSQKSHISAWLSPWGGYNEAKERRVKNAKEKGLETNAEGLSLSTPKYYEAFRDRCMQMVKDYDMNMFKFDGIGAGPLATGAPDRVAPDLAGLIKLIGELRAQKQDIFINCTVGTWASPFWVRYADCIWRGGHDHSSLGTGLRREQWITYRDQVVYERFASVSPLYPLNSLMNHGLIVSECYGMEIGDTDTYNTAYLNELWMGIACGTGLQEYYVSPHLMSQKWWDALADGIKWLRANKETLRDVHWVGGEPKKEEVYGYASWSESKGILILRNPAGTSKTFKSSLSKVFELPSDAAQSIDKITHVYGSTLNANEVVKVKNATETLEIVLPPYETLLFEVTFKK